MTIAAEMRGIVFGAAEPVSPGDTVKAQQRRAWDALRRPAWWRLRAAWYGEADCWSARAVEDMRRRNQARCEREERARASAERLGAIYADIAQRSDMDRARADHLLDLAGALGSGRGPVDYGEKG